MAQQYHIVDRTDAAESDTGFRTETGLTAEEILSNASEKPLGVTYDNETQDKANTCRRYYLYNSENLAIFIRKRTIY